MYFHANLKKKKIDRHFIVKNVWIKNICKVVELPKNPRNPL